LPKKLPKVIFFWGDAGNGVPEPTRPGNLKIGSHDNALSRGMDTKLQCLLFDLDNTLYPRELGIFDRVVARIWDYLILRMGFEEEVAGELRKEYIRKYGSTLRGLMTHYHIDPEDYLDYVHDVGVEDILTPNPALQALLRSIPFQKALFTSSHRPHAVKVLRCLGVEEYFPFIFDITLTGYIPKPNIEPYQQVLQTLSVSGERCMMIEDVVANLKPAKDLGMTTVLVGSASAPADGFVDYGIGNILELGPLIEEMEWPFRQREGSPAR